MLKGVMVVVIVVSSESFVYSYASTHILSLALSSLVDSGNYIVKPYPFQFLQSIFRDGLQSVES